MKTMRMAIWMMLFALLMTGPAEAGEYDHALEGVDGVKAVFDVSMGDAGGAPVVFKAVRDVYQDATVRGLASEPEVVVVFHGGAVTLISTDREGYSEGEAAKLDEFAKMLREMKADGVRFEVCMYAVEVLGVDPQTIMDEVDRVGNGFISVVGYQQQGYAVVVIP
jgi:intracellular sulfur oxidation DsrE/DsrF family protein